MASKRFTIGRFQTDEPTKGHQRILNDLHSGDIVFVGSANASFSKRNPLPVSARIKMLRDRYPQLVFIPIDDYQSDSVWAQRVDDLLGVGPWTGLSGQDGFWNTYHTAGGKWKVVVVMQDGPLSESTRRREDIGSHLKIDNLDKRQALIWTAHNLRDQVFPTVDILCLKNTHTIRDASVIVGRKPNETLFRFPGGFVDVADQSLLDAAKREFSEEVPGIEVGNWKYATSRKINDWRFTGSQGIMTTVFTCRYVFGAVKGGDDLAIAQWARVESLRPELMVPEHRPLAEFLLKELS